MLSTIFGGYAILIALLVAYLAHISLSGRDKQRRDDAYRVLKLIWGTATGATGLAAVLLRLHNAGLL